MEKSSPALSQIFGLDEISGFLYDIQITTAPITVITRLASTAGIQRTAPFFMT